MADIAISVKNVSKDFKLPHERVDSVKSLFTQPFRRRGGTTTQHALKDISFDIKKGEFFGIVGRNGSGKSTLLKIIAGIYQPTKGSVTVDGRLVPFIELGVGFNPELSGRENVYLNGALMGFSQKEIKAKYQSIVEFAEIEQFMDQKLKNYSSGMQVRLAFSVATILAESDILLIDEVLAVGDADFQKKCFDYFKKLKRQKKTVVFVSHDMSSVQEFCDRAVLVNDSRILYTGRPEKIAKEYDRLFMTKAEPVNNVENDAQPEKWGIGGVDTSKVVSKKEEYTNKDDLVEFGYTITSKGYQGNVIAGFAIKDEQGRTICGTNSKIVKQSPPKLGKDGQATIQLTWSVPNIFNQGVYTIEPSVMHSDGRQMLQWWNNAKTFKVANKYSVPVHLIAPPVKLIVE